MAYWQTLSRSLVLPFLALPLVAVLMHVASWSFVTDGVAHVCRVVALTVLSAMPYVFAVAIALGMTRQAPQAGIAALIGMFVCTHVAYGDQASVFAGVIMGMVTAIVYEQCKDVQFPGWVQFFGGSRFAVLAVSIGSMAVGLLFVVGAPMINKAVHTVAAVVLDDGGGFAVFAYGVVHRLLVPLGLHHLINHVVLFQIGSYTTDGITVTGDVSRFFAGDPRAGRFMAGLFPVMMGALPAAALAMWRSALPAMRKRVGLLMGSAIVASFGVGITEPIELAFLFVAPWLYIVHAVCTGFMMWLAYVLDVRHGFSFSAGVFDFVINAHASHNIHWLFVIGIVGAIGYYVLFRFAIERWDLPTPGRRADAVVLHDAASTQYDRVERIVAALGGMSNIVQIDACVTRLRLIVHTPSLVDAEALRKLGAFGVIFIGERSVQVVFGTASERIRERIVDSVQRPHTNAVSLRAPWSGRLVPLDEVPDPVFAQRLIGDGVAIMLTDHMMVAPVSGVVTLIYPTGHALGLRTPEGIELLMHVGIEEGVRDPSHYAVVVHIGQAVRVGEPLMRCTHVTDALIGVLVVCTAPRGSIEHVGDDVRDVYVTAGTSIVMTVRAHQGGQSDDQ
ncbi:MAG: PTS transporter subunit EIIC [Paenibacillaceae bacterium]|nr:PTS transporter subunit EIIC [Paenibacillaceae bacterium]